MSEPACMLYGSKGGGSMIVEAAFALAGQPLELVDVPWAETGWQSPVLQDLNPLGQVPTLRLPDGSVMTESAAIVLWLAERFPAAQLAPPAADPRRGEFLRWLMFLVAAVYPTFTYGDVPERWVGDDATAGEKLKAGTDRHREMLWRYLEPRVGVPWFLGPGLTALDLYLWAMTTWRPGRDWFRAGCPRLHAIAAGVDAHPVCRPVGERNGIFD